MQAGLCLRLICAARRKLDRCVETVPSSFGLVVARHLFISFEFMSALFRHESSSLSSFDSNPATPLDPPLLISCSSFFFFFLLHQRRIREILFSTSVCGLTDSAEAAEGRNRRH